MDVKIGQLIKSDENKISTVERKVLRSICDPIKVNRDWRTRWNHELYQFSDFCNHHTVISITVSSFNRSYIEYTWMPARIYQYVINLVVSLPIRNVSVRQSLQFYHHYRYYPNVDSYSQLLVWKYFLSPLLHWNLLTEFLCGT